MSKSMSRRTFLGTMGVAASLAMAGCGSSTSSTTTTASTTAATDDVEADLGLVTEGKLTVGMSPDFPPFENLEDGEYVGLDCDLATAMAEKLGLEVEFKNLQFDAIVPAVAAGGQVDCGISGITIDPERSEQVDFTTSYYVDDLCIVTMKDATEVTADNYADALNGEAVVIAAQTGTTGESYAQENFPNATVTGYGNATDCFADLQAGNVLAVVTNKAVGAKMVAEAYTDAQVIKEIATGEEYGVAVSKDNAVLYDALDGVILELIDDGTIDEIIETYFG